MGEVVILSVARSGMSLRVLNVDGSKMLIVSYMFFPFIDEFPSYRCIPSKDMYSRLSCIYQHLRPIIKYALQNLY